MNIKKISESFLGHDGDEDYKLVEECEFDELYEKTRCNIYRDEHGKFWSQRITSYHDSTMCYVGNKIDDKLIEVKKKWRAVE